MNKPTPVDVRIATFLQLWASASVAAHAGEWFVAVVRFTEAARQAPTCADETRSLCRAFECYERLRGPYEPRLGDPV